MGGLLTGFAGDVGDSLAWLARRMVDGELWFGARGFSFASLWGLEELWWRERLPLHDVTDARPGACLRGSGIGQTVETVTSTTTMHTEPGLMVGS